MAGILTTSDPDLHGYKRRVHQIRTTESVRCPLWVTPLWVYLWVTSLFKSRGLSAATRDRDLPRRGKRLRLYGCMTPVPTRPS